MVVKLIGKVDGQDIIFNRISEGRWETTVPSNLDCEYVVEITAIDEAGNVAYVTKMLLTFDPASLCIHLSPINYDAELVENAKYSMVLLDYAIELAVNNYEAEVECERTYLEVIYPMCRGVIF